MKNIFFILAIVVGSVFTASAQTATSQTANEGFVGYSFLRQDVKFERPRFHFDENTDSHGFDAAYTRYLGGSATKAGVFGLTADLGANFDNNEASLVTAMAGATVKARNLAYVQPFVHALGGVARQHVNRKNILDTTDYSVAFMAGGGFDINVKRLSRYKIRFSADYVNTSFGGKRQDAARLTTGLVF